MGANVKRGRICGGGSILVGFWIMMVLYSTGSRTLQGLEQGRKGVNGYGKLDGFCYGY